MAINFNDMLKQIGENYQTLKNQSRDVNSPEPDSYSFLATPIKLSQPKLRKKKTK